MQAGVGGEGSVRRPQRRRLKVHPLLGGESGDAAERILHGEGEQEHIGVVAKC